LVLKNVHLKILFGIYGTVVSELNLFLNNISLHAMVIGMYRFYGETCSTQYLSSLVYILDTR